jgi:hypothetical protein
MWGSSARSRSRRAGKVATSVRRYAAMPVSANSWKRRLLTALGGAI